MESKEFPKQCFNCIHISENSKFCLYSKQDITDKSSCNKFEVIKEPKSYCLWKRAKEAQAGIFKLNEEYSLFLENRNTIMLKNSDKKQIEKFKFKSMNNKLLNRIGKVLCDIGAYKRKKDAMEDLYNHVFVPFSELAPIVESEKETKKDESVKLDVRFYMINLLEQIWKELDKTHKLDHKEKLALFVTALTGELKNPSERCSVALKGDSSAGKDSAIKTVLKHFPEKDSFFLTRGTVSALEDEAEKVKRIAFSEINKHREGGANSELTEVFKQLAEGGTDVIKKDSATGFSTTKRIKSTQKCLIYGTTETESDDELETRYVIIPIKGYAEKNKFIVDDVLDKVSNLKFCLDSINKDESWIAQGISQLNHNCHIIIPFAQLLKNKIKDGDKEIFFFDYSKERIKRDSKRLLSLTKAITWIYQKQRVIISKENTYFLFSEPSDFITAVSIFSDFFNLTYSGMDFRHQKCLEKIRELEGKHNSDILKLGFENKYFGYVLRHKLQEELGISSINTMKQRIESLKDLGYIKDTHYQREINPKAYLIKSMGVNEGINRISMPVKLTALTAHLTTFLTPNNLSKIYKNKKIEETPINFLEKTVESINSNVYIKKIDTLKNDTLKSNIEEEYVEDIEDLIDFIAKYGDKGCKVEEFITQYDEKSFNYVLNDKRVLENPSGILRVI